MALQTLAHQNLWLSMAEFWADSTPSADRGTKVFGAMKRAESRLVRTRRVTAYMSLRPCHCVHDVFIK